MRIIDALAFVGEGRYQRQSAAELLVSMDRCGVHAALVAPPEEQITVYNEEGNAAVAALCAAHAGRLFGYAVANPWYGERAVETLRKALDAGLCGVYFDSSIQGFAISDSLVDPLIAVCAEYDVPAYFHTGTPAFALPFQLHFLAKRFPSVRFIMGHGGANDFASDALPALAGVRNVWVETSMNLTVTMRGLLAEAPDRVLFGSASPRSDLGYELGKLRAAGADEAALARALSGNFAEVFGGRI